MGVLQKSEPQAHWSLPGINRRRFIGIAALAGAGIISADGVLIEPMLPKLVHTHIALRRWPSAMDGFTLALLSDFHYDPIFSIHPIKSSVQIVNDIRPDLVLLAGDFITSTSLGIPRRSLTDAEPCARLLQPLRARHGVWAVMGNHDVIAGSPRVTAALQSFGIPVLANSAVPIEQNGGRFWLAGVGDVLKRGADLHSALQLIPSDEATVLMAHEPDYADYVARYPVDLQLSGHTHGGQILLPLIPPLYLPPLGRKYVRGVHCIGGLTLYTTAGIGTIGLPVRLRCPPEITLVTIRRG